MASAVQNLLASVPAWAAYLIVFGMPFLEASVLLGFVFPGETALVFGGVLASQGHVSLIGMLVLAILGAITGDAIGFAVGRRYGAALQVSRLGQIVGPARWHTTEDFLHRRGGPAVFFGRFAALLRALVPGVAGMAGIPYRTFALWNLLGGGAWASICVLGGYALGDVIDKYLSGFGYAVIGLLILAAIGYLLHRHHGSGSARSGDPTRSDSAQPDDSRQPGEPDDSVQPDGSPQMHDSAHSTQPDEAARSAQLDEEPDQVA